MPYRWPSLKRVIARENKVRCIYVIANTFKCWTLLERWLQMLKFNVDNADKGDALVTVRGH